jgi:phage tail sheath protein FI
MAFYLSPGVAVVEKDFTSIVPAVSTSTGAFAGLFQWGPVLDPVTVSSENFLAQTFGKPNDGTASSFFTAANFLSYSNNLLTVRIDTADSLNAVSISAGQLLSATVVDAGSGYTDVPAITFSPTSAGTLGEATLKVVGSITVANGGSGYAEDDVILVNIGSGVEATFVVTGETAGVITSVDILNAGSYTIIAAASLTGVATTAGSGEGSGATLTFALGLNTVTVSGGDYNTAPNVLIDGSASTNSSSVTATISASGVKVKNQDDYDTNSLGGSNLVGTWAAKYPGSLGNSLLVSISDSSDFTTWAYSGEFDSAPGTSTQATRDGGSNDEVHVIVIDEDGQITGTAGAILEKYSYLSKASDNKKSDGANNYYKTVINEQSQWIWWMDHPDGSTGWGSPSSTDFDNYAFETSSLTGGVDDFAPDDGDYQDGFALFANDELYDISLVPTGHVSATVAQYVIDNVVETRRDCIAFVSPVSSTDGPIIGSGATQLTEIQTYRNTSLNRSTSYAVLDSGWKYQYDRYNDAYRWIPLNGDIAGLCARTDLTNDPWWSPGGLNRGQIKNVVKLGFNPNKTYRDELYKIGVNPVVSFPGQGVVLFGDKTLLSKPSAFDRINVRRLFIVLEKAIATAAKFQLFEFNDSFTRSQFKALVEPFLRDVQGRRGVIDFRVKCDDQNNTGEVIDRNEFVADIFIKPNRSINFITLNFVAARTSVSFEEIGA